MIRGFAILGLASLAGGAMLAAVYGPRDGLLMAALMLTCGAPAIAGAHLLARRRAAAGSLSRQFAAGTAVTVTLGTIAVGAIALAMFISPHDALLMVVLLGFAGMLTAYSAHVLASGVLRDIEAVRDGLRAVGGGGRGHDVAFTTEARDEVGELAEAVNLMA